MNKFIKNKRIQFTCSTHMEIFGCVHGFERIDFYCKNPLYIKYVNSNDHINYIVELLKHMSYNSIIHYEELEYDGDMQVINDNYYEIYKDKLEKIK